MIRIATQEDVRSIVDVGLNFFHETAYVDEVDVDEEKSLSTISGFIDDPSYLVLVVEHDSQIVGYMIAIACPMYYFSHTMISCDLTIYLQQDARGGKDFVKMIKEYEKWARAKGVKPENIGVGNSGSRKPIKFHAFFKRLGYHERAILFRKNKGAE